MVQPGLEFAPTHVDHFDMTAPNKLSAALSDEPGICFEAHSTDYQADGVFPDLASRNFAILKVGPALTFAYRQALYSLDQLRGALHPKKTGPTIYQVMETLMLASPGNWEKHYSGTPEDKRLQRHFGYADRIRYYWPALEAQNAVSGLFSDLAGKRPPRPLLEQFFAPEIIARAEALSASTDSWATALVLAQIQSALSPYFFNT